MLEKLKQAKKALAAPIGVVLGWWLMVLQSSDPGVTATEWWILAAGVAATAGITWVVPNKPPVK